jgi:photosystem II stability/assembly factor-like uncharacterized protein
MTFKRYFILISLFALSVNQIYSQKKKKSSTQITPKAEITKGPFCDSCSVGMETVKGLKWRNIGPFRAGRSLAVAGVASQPLVYYFGAVGGGVWKSTDGGGNWASIGTDVFQSSSVGAISVAPSDPNIIYVGMGEADMRSNISYGDGIYKSADAGKTWKHMSLKAADAIANIEIHPTNSDIAFVSAMGNPFAPNKERGVYRTKDGGKTWDLVLSKNDSTGAISVSIDKVNPLIIYASLWQAYRNGYSMSSGGKGSGLYKSVDGGDTWTNLNEMPGMPKGILGKIGVSVSPANPNRVFALIENAKGGLYRSEDAGAHWSLINEDKNIWQRPWYYMNLVADPSNPNGLIVLNVNSYKSEDGGKSFSHIPVHHGDTHDAWINPNNSKNFIIGDDGGAEVTFNGGATFSDIDIPTSQFYHVSIDNDFPYNVYGAQQDNSSIRIASRTDGGSIGSDSWFPVAGGEAGYIQADPLNSDITFGGEYDGQLSSYNKKNNQYKVISPYPETGIGAPGTAKKYRFQWTYPIVFSPHDPKVMYVTSNYVHKTTDAGHSWEVISPDLTKNDPKTSGETGGPITKDMTGAEIYNTIFTFAESPIEKGQLWTGSDDGIVQLSRDAGKTWQNVTPPTSLLPDWSLMSLIHPSEHKNGTAYLAANRYMSGDKTPYLLKTNDFGKTWMKIVTGLPADEYCRVVRVDPLKDGLLYAGTERGIYVSFDDGAVWRKLNNNLPLTPIRDLQIHKRDKDLVVATHGRSFWIMDDITPLHEIMDNKTKENAHLYKPKAAYRVQGGQGGERLDVGRNAPNGVIIRYFLKKKEEKELKLVFLTMANDTIITYSSTKDKKGEPIKISKEFHEDVTITRPGTIPSQVGLNTFVWDMRYPDAVSVEGTNVMWAGDGVGAKAVPGLYKVILMADKTVLGEQTIEILKDPRKSETDADYKESFDFIQNVNKSVTETHKAINKIRKVRSQINGYVEGIKDTLVASKFKKEAKPINTELDEIEAQLMQPKAKAPQDVLAFPVMLNDKMAGVASGVANSDTKPTKSSYTVYNDLKSRIDFQLNKLKTILDSKIPAFNKLVADQKIPAIILDK